MNLPQFQQLFTELGVINPLAATIGLAIDQLNRGVITEEEFKAKVVDLKQLLSSNPTAIPETELLNTAINSLSDFLGA